MFFIYIYIYYNKTTKHHCNQNNEIFRHSCAFANSCILISINNLILIKVITFYESTFKIKIM